MLWAVFKCHLHESNECHVDESTQPARIVECFVHSENTRSQTTLEKMRKSLGVPTKGKVNRQFRKYFKDTYDVGCGTFRYKCGSYSSSGSPTSLDSPLPLFFLGISWMERSSTGSLQLTTTNQEKFIDDEIFGAHFSGDSESISCFRYFSPRQFVHFRRWQNTTRMKDENKKGSS